MSRSSTRARVLELWARGMRPVEISRRLGLNRSVASAYLRAAAKAGLIEKSPHELAQERIDAVKAVIAQRYADAPDLDALAAELGISVRTLGKTANRMGVHRTVEASLALRKTALKAAAAKRAPPTDAAGGRRYGRGWRVHDRPAHELHGCVAARIYRMPA